MIEKLGLPIFEHLQPYSLENLEDLEFKDMCDVMVIKQVQVSFNLGRYEDKVLCDAVPTKLMYL